MSELDEGTIIIKDITEEIEDQSSLKNDPISPENAVHAFADDVDFEKEYSPAVKNCKRFKMLILSRLQNQRFLINLFSRQQRRQKQLEAMESKFTKKESISMSSKKYKVTIERKNKIKV